MTYRLQLDYQLAHQRGESVLLAIQVCKWTTLREPADSARQEAFQTALGRAQLVLHQRRLTPAFSSSGGEVEQPRFRLACHLVA